MITRVNHPPCSQVLHKTKIREVRFRLNEGTQKIWFKVRFLLKGIVSECVMAADVSLGKLTSGDDNVVVREKTLSRMLYDP